jgi:hypothetical protein
MLSELTYKEDEIVYLNSIDHVRNGVVTRIGDTFKINTILSPTKIILSEVSTTTLNPLLKDGIFITNDSENRWNYLSKTKFYKSKIKSGLFKRSYFNNII